LRGWPGWLRRAAPGERQRRRAGQIEPGGPGSRWPWLRPWFTVGPEASLGEDTGRHDAVGHQGDGRGTAVGGGAQRHTHAVLGGELGPDEQAKAVGIGEVEVGRAGELLVDLTQLVGFDAEA